MKTALMIGATGLVGAQLLLQLRNDERFDQVVAFGRKKTRNLNAVGVARKYREIGGDVVARAMVNAALDTAKGTSIFTLDEIFAEAARAR